MTCTVERDHMFTVRRCEATAHPGRGRPGAGCLTIAGSQGPPPRESSSPRAGLLCSPIHWQETAARVTWSWMLAAGLPPPKDVSGLTIR